MSDPIESVIFGEGYLDRAFWKGWLKHSGCTDLGEPEAGREGPKPVYDPWGDRVSGGQYGFRSRSEHFIRVVPCRGKDKIVGFARRRLKDRKRRPLANLILNVDSDQNAGLTDGGTCGIGPQRFEQLVHEFDPAVQVGTTNQVSLGDTQLCVIRWETDDPSAQGLPRKQALERLVCAVVVAAYPDRAEPLQKWLDSRPAPPAANPKAHAWSYMAGWYPDNGCEDFYAHVWRDEKIAPQLEARLKAAGAWDIIEQIAS